MKTYKMYSKEKKRVWRKTYETKRREAFKEVRFWVDMDTYNEVNAFAKSNNMTIAEALRTITVWGLEA